MSDRSEKSDPPSTEPQDEFLSARTAQYDALRKSACVRWTSERRFVKVLGRGGQGSVLLAEREGAGAFRIPVAMKFFSPKPFSSEAEYDTEMLRLAEVSAMVAGIQDDHLVHVYSFLRRDDIYFLEMEWIDGFNLLHILRRDTFDLLQDALTKRRLADITQKVVTTGEVDCRLKPGMAVAVLKECLAGVSALHRHGVMHCDLKPSNVMVKRTGQVKIIDIGSAYWVGRPPAGQPCTLEYAAPEVLAGYRATPQSDLASLGYMLIEMLTGLRPFSGLTYSEIVEAKQTIIDRLPSMLPQDEFAFSEPLIILLRRLIDPNPLHRFPSAEEAELSQEGAAGFLRELVKSDLWDEYTLQLRQWIAEMEARPQTPTDAVEAVPDGTTRMVALAASGEEPSQGFEVGSSVHVGQVAEDHPPMTGPGPAPDPSDEGGRFQVDFRGAPDDEHRAGDEFVARPEPS